MIVTFVVKDLTEQYMDQLKEADPVTQFESLKRCKHDNLKVSFKIGTGQFRDQVEFNQLCRSPHTFDVVWADRRGYKLVTFTYRKLND